MKLFILTLISFLIYSSAPNVSNAKTVTGSHLIGGSFSLTNHKGKVITDKNFRGKYMLVFFGFTHCASVCPLGLQKMTSVLNKLNKKMRSEIAPIFITVDPKRDDYKTMAKYVKLYSDDLIGLTGSEDAINKTVKNYRAFYRKQEVDKSGDYQMDHSDILYFMGKDGKYLGHYSSKGKTRSIAKKIKKLIITSNKLP